MEKSKENDNCSCVGNHTCDKTEPENAVVENLGTVLVGVLITPSCEGNVPVEQEHASTEFIESGAYANYPYVCTPVIPEATSGKDMLLVPTVSVLGSDGTSSESELLSVPITSLEGSSDTSPEADATTSSSEIASNIRTSISTQITEDPSQSVPKEGSVTPDKKSTSPQRPTDINVGQRTSFHEFSGSEKDGILKCMQFVIPANQEPPPKPRRRRSTDPTREARPENASAGEGSSSSDSKSKPSTESCATSFDTLTGSSSVSEDAEAEAAIQRMRSSGPKVSLTFNLGGDTSTANPSTGGVDSSEAKSVESATVEDSQQASNPNEDVLQVGSNDEEGFPGMGVPGNVEDSEDIPTVKRPES